MTLENKGTHSSWKVKRYQGMLHSHLVHYFRSNFKNSCHPITSTDLGFLHILVPRLLMSSLTSSLGITSYIQIIVSCFSKPPASPRNQLYSLSENTLCQAWRPGRSAMSFHSLTYYIFLLIQLLLSSSVFLTIEKYSLLDFRTKKNPGHESMTLFVYFFLLPFRRAPDVTLCTMV